MPSVYTLNTGAPGKETSRLDFQHGVFLKMTGTLLPPDISVSISSSSNIHVADLACGTAIWLKSLTPQLPPTAQLHGFDMSTHKFPAPSTLPANFHLHTHNVLDPFTEQYLGVFDVAHVRLLMYGLKKEEWILAVKNVMTILKPGGWLFWEETGYQSWYTLPPSRALHELLVRDVQFAQNAGRDIRSPALLLRHFTNAGLIDCQQKEHSSISDHSLDKDANTIMLNVWTQAMTGLVDKGFHSKDEADGFVEAVKKDLEKGCQANCDMDWVWGKKSPTLRPDFQ